MCNAAMSSCEIRAYCGLNDETKTILRNAMERMGLSARAYDRILKVSRTIADLDASEQVEAKHIAEAIQYRTMDRT